jgi:hypothetical protein
MGSMISLRIDLWLSGMERVGVVRYVGKMNMGEL